MAVSNAAIVLGAVIRRQKEIVSAFRAAAATSRDRATTAAKLAIDEGMAFKILCRHAILRDAGEQRLYLDEPAWEAHESKRRRIAVSLVSTIALALTGAVVWLLCR